MNTSPTLCPVRDEIEKALRDEIVGPGPLRSEWAHLHKDEILGPQDKPRQRFSAGILFPRKSRVQDDVDDREDVDIASPSDAPEADALPDSVDERLDDIQAQHRFENGADGRAPSDVDERHEHNPNEQEINRANEYLPSAMGLTCLVEVPKRLVVTVSAATYEERLCTELADPKKPERKPQPHSFRHSFSSSIIIDGERLLSGTRVVLSPEVDTSLRVIQNDTASQLAIHVFSRTVPGRTSSNQRLVTVTLMNLRECGPDERPGDDDCYYQCGFSLGAEDGSLCMLEYPERGTSAVESADPEEAAEARLLALLYREQRVFAIGHGCAAEWSDADGGRVAEIKTEVLPRYELRPIGFDIHTLQLPMGLLASGSDTEIIKLCVALASRYEAWIAERRAELPAIQSEHRTAAETQVEKCSACLGRIRGGIEVLRTNADAMQVFRWMNEAMQKQGIHYKRASDAEWKRPMHFPVQAVEGPPAQPGRRASRRRHQTAENPEPSKPFTPPTQTELDDRKWRPFQLAFILMNLRSMVDPSGAGRFERELVDLIWFPTGGGKTEAYLGLTAFTILWRRLKKPSDAATTVLMRYTLRLLTTQQFQRAATLICACDLIRQREPRLHGTPISIGLWVGGSVTPNKQTDALHAWNLLHREGKPNPFVLLSCPWCGCGLGAVKEPKRWRPDGSELEGGFRVAGYERIGDDDERKIVFSCPDRECPFHSSVPVHVVDEAIYDERPTLVIGTVDKFAMMPWNPLAMRLFGLSSGLGRQHAPPSLIIQDELHLISGALGSMVGHYEMTIDALTRDGDVPAKIIASTATICRASHQVKMLYDRHAEVFPPQGLLASDSFFAQEDGSNDAKKRSRVYLGIMGTALGSHVTAQVRTLATLLQTPATIDRDGQRADEVDPYWTLMCYFNSLRELGHAASLVHADIQERLFYLWSRLGIQRPTTPSQVDARRFVNRDEELTSRVSGSDVAETLSRLFERCSGMVNEKGIRQHKALDVCLATNMIQVGLDVSRLGLMAVIGQPKGTSEYIQATSRVGRGVPGLVVTIYNASKPRDRSHYEHFRSYHQSLYRWVEPTSVTPFALPVRERALHAQLITLARYWSCLDEFGQRHLVSDPTTPPDARLEAAIRDEITKRCSDIDLDELHGVRSRLDLLFKRWRDYTPRNYGGFALNDESRLMYPMGAKPLDAWKDYALRTPSSMRGVDATCDASVLGRMISNPPTQS